MPAPSSIYVCRWHTDPNFHGSYSFIPTGFNLQEDLEKNVGRIYFAGEAYSKRYSGYVHGAYNSGQKVAEDVIELI
jgi:polyamine oxidase